MFLADSDLETIGANTYARILNKLPANSWIKRKWKTQPLTVQFMQDYFAIVLFMGIARLPERHMYWESNIFLSTFCNNSHNNNIEGPIVFHGRIVLRS